MREAHAYSECMVQAISKLSKRNKGERKETGRGGKGRERGEMNEKREGEREEGRARMNESVVEYYFKTCYICLCCGTFV